MLTLSESSNWYLCESSESHGRNFKTVVFLHVMPCNLIDGEHHFRVCLFPWNTDKNLQDFMGDSKVLIDSWVFQSYMPPPQNSPTHKQACRMKMNSLFPQKIGIFKIISPCYANGEERKNSEQFQTWKKISNDEF